MEIFGPLLITSLAGLSTVIGVLPVFFNIKKKEEFISFSLAFSLSIMVSISIFDLIPSSYLSIVGEVGLIKGTALSLSLFLISVFIINYSKKFINKLSKKYTNNLYKIGLLNMFVLMLHNIPEGIATFITTSYDFELGIKLGIAIMMHNVPEGIAIAIPLYFSTGKRRVGVLYTFISGLSEPIGGLIAYLLLRNFITDLLISYILLIVGGIMITLSINEIYPEAIKYNKKREIILGLLLGVVVILFNIIF